MWLIAAGMGRLCVGAPKCWREASPIGSIRIRLDTTNSGASAEDAKARGSAEWRAPAEFRPYCKKGFQNVDHSRVPINTIRPC